MMHTTLLEIKSIDNNIKGFMGFVVTIQLNANYFNENSVKLILLWKSFRKNL